MWKKEEEEEERERNTYVPHPTQAMHRRARPDQQATNPQSDGTRAKAAADALGNLIQRHILDIGLCL